MALILSQTDRQKERRKKTEGKELLSVSKERLRGACIKDIVP